MPEQHLNKRVTKLEERINHLEHQSAPRQEDKETNQPQQTASEKDDSAKGKVSLPRDIPPSPTNTKKPQKPWYKTPDGWKTAVELVAIPFAIGYAVVTYYEWKDLRHNFTIEQRSWLKATLDWSKFQTDNSVPIVIANFGKSPAVNPRIMGKMEILDADSLPTFIWKLTPHSVDQESLIFPGDPRFAFGAAMLEKTSKEDRYTFRRLTPDEALRLANGKSYVIVWGFIIYDDSFGNHWTRFCEWKNFPKDPTEYREFQARPCVVWNSVGDGKSPDE